MGEREIIYSNRRPAMTDSLVTVTPLPNDSDSVERMTDPAFALKSVGSDESHFNVS